MISAQTRSAFVARENRHPPIGAWPEGMLFRIMLWRLAPTPDGLALLTKVPRQAASAGTSA